MSAMGEHAARHGANGSADLDLSGDPPGDRELLLRAVEGSKLAAEEASRASARVEVLRVELGHVKKQISDLVAHEDGRRLEAAELRQIIGEAPKAIDVARAELERASHEELERWERTHGLRGQMALVIASMRAEAKTAARGRTLLGALVVALQALPEVLRYLQG